MNITMNDEKHTQTWRFATLIKIAVRMFLAAILVVFIFAFFSILFAATGVFYQYIEEIIRQLLK